MRQIPSEGELCGDCYQEWRGLSWWCLVYEQEVSSRNPDKLISRRCDKCLRDKPQVLTEEERQILELKGFQKGIAQAAGNIYTPKEDIEED